MSHTGCLRTGSFVSWFMKGDPHIPGFFRLHPLIIYNKQLSWIFQCSSRLNQKLVQSNLVGGFNPSENISQNGNLPPNRGENKKYLKFHHLKMFWTIQNDQARIRSLRLNDPGPNQIDTEGSGVPSFLNHSNQQMIYCKRIPTYPCFAYPRHPQNPKMEGISS